ncbi:MAG: DUF262 domain-containing protein [Bilifractor sp.]|nr:DUF262 domain-containing protein [Bilifractor sp.]
MNKTTTKTITISDLVQWDNRNEIQLSPKYQRNHVWNEKAKAYLIDTIVRGLPIPPIFMRMIIDVRTKSTVYEIIDGQQRVRAILEYVVGESFTIKRSHNKELGGKRYSDLDDELKAAVLSYEISAEVVTENDESVIYDMFARLNSNNYVLNPQEIRNSKYWGEFKVLAYKLASEYRDFFIENQIFKDKEIIRMNDVEFINALVVLAIEGITNETQTAMNKIYEKYDAAIPNEDSLENKIASVMGVIENVYQYLNGTLGVFQNKNYLYTLFGVVYNQMYGLKDSSLPREERYSEKNIEANISGFISEIVDFINYLEQNSRDNGENQIDYDKVKEFQSHHKQRTTGKNGRTQRITFLNKYLCDHIQ